MIHVAHVDGRERGSIVIYALSTCGWCKKTKHLLQELGLAYDYVDVDMVEGEESREVDAMVTRWNPRKSFPTVIVDNERCIVGFNEDEIRKLNE
jgi:glutaredoxin